MLKSTKLKKTLLIGTTTILVSCSGQNEIKMGSYAYDAEFLKKYGIEYTELVSADGNAKVMVIPAWQGRVMTTSASGDEGDSYGWINYRCILRKDKNRFMIIGWFLQYLTQSLLILNHKTITVFVL